MRGGVVEASGKGRCTQRPGLNQRESRQERSPLQLLFYAFILPLMSTSIALPFELHFGSGGLCRRPVISKKYFLGMTFRTKHGIFCVVFCVVVLLFVQIFLLRRKQPQRIKSTTAVEGMDLESNSPSKLPLKSFRSTIFSGPRQDAIKLASSKAFSCFASDSFRTVRTQTSL